MKREYVSGWCGTRDCHRCSGSYPNGTKAASPTTDCACRCHRDGQLVIIR